MRRLIGVVFMLALAATAEARPRPHGFSSAGKFEANKKFGIGLELIEPTGVTGKWFLSPSGALDFGLGGLYRNYYVNGQGAGLHLYADYLWHPVLLTKTSSFELPLYIGVGGRFWSFDYNCGGGRICSGASAFGVRVPVGIAFDFENVPLDIFIQIVPTLDFYRDFVPHKAFLDVDFSVGIRYWFQ